VGFAPSVEDGAFNTPIEFIRTVLDLREGEDDDDMSSFKVAVLSAMD
jgi:hypothetical protein